MKREVRVTSVHTSISDIMLQGRETTLSANRRHSPVARSAPRLSDTSEGCPAASCCERLLAKSSATADLQVPNRKQRRASPSASTGDQNLPRAVRRPHTHRSRADHPAGNARAHTRHSPPRPADSIGSRRTVPIAARRRRRSNPLAEAPPSRARANDHHKVNAGVLRRAEISQSPMRLGGDGFEQRRSQPRLANAGLAGEQHNLTFASFCPRPPPQQQFKFFLAADEGRQADPMQRLKTACRRAWSQCRPSAHRGYNSAEALCSQILEFKQIAEKLSCALGDNNGTRLGDSLEPRGEARGFADDAVLLRASRIGYIADNYEASCNPDARLQWRAVSQCSYRRNQFKRRSNRSAQGRPRAREDSQNKPRQCRRRRAPRVRCADGRSQRRSGDSLR